MNPVKKISVSTTVAANQPRQVSPAVKRILIFSLAYFPKHVGGAEVAIKEITDRLSSNAYEFHLICNRFDSTLPRRERIGNVVVHRIGWERPHVTTADTHRAWFYLIKIWYVPLAAWTAWRLHSIQRFDAWWCMMLYMSYPVALLRFAGLRLPYVISLQEGDTYERVFERWYIKLAQPILLYAIRRATVVQSISTYLAGWARDKKARGKCVVIPNGADTTHFSQSYEAAQLHDIRAELGVALSDVVLVTTSRLVPKNAVDQVIKALPRLPGRVKFVVFGIGPEEQRLRILAKELAVEERVIWGGHLAHEQMPLYLKACDIFVRPSRSEGMGVSFIEAMAAGLPVVATQVGGIADFLFDAKHNPDQPTTGWAVDVDAPAEIAHAVEDIILHPDIVEQVTQRASTLVATTYDWDMVATRMDKEVFQSLWHHEK